MPSWLVTDQRLPKGHQIAAVLENLLDNAVTGGGDLAHHLHGLDETDGLALLHPVSHRHEGCLIRRRCSVEGAHQGSGDGRTLLPGGSRGRDRCRCRNSRSGEDSRRRGSGDCPVQLYRKTLLRQLQALECAALKAVHQVKNFLIGHGASFLHGKWPAGGIPRRAKDYSLWLLR